MTGHPPPDDHTPGGYHDFAYGAERDDAIYDDRHDGDWHDEGEDTAYDEDHAAQMTRRRFLAGFVASSTVGAGAFWAIGRNGGANTATPPTTLPAPSTTPTTFASVPASTSTTSTTVPAEIEGLTPAPVDQRVLVLIELEGGNDGPSTVVPVTQGAYYDLRPTLAIPAEQALMIDDEVGLHPSLTRLHGRQMAVIDGVGPVEGTMSHFEMVARWEQGDMLGNTSQRSGFLARLADSLDTGFGAIGLSTAGHTPRFNNVNATTLSLTDLNQLNTLTRDDWIFPDFRRATTQFRGGPMTTTMADSWERLSALSSALPAGLGDFDDKIPMITESRELGKQLAMAAKVITADVGVRVVHVRLGGFDTHKGHEWKQERLMGEFDVAVAGFLDQMEAAGMADRVLVATSSEFGRRGKENGNGLDHGAGSTMLAFGPVVPGRHGEPLSFTNLDSRGNLATTVPFDVYLATLAEDWLGVEAASVLPGSPERLRLVPQVAAGADG